MGELFHLAVAVLAAGNSTRFGSTDKLVAEFRGKMLGHHVVETLAEFPGQHKWVIASQAGHQCNEGWAACGFETVVNSCSEQGMGTSVALAASQAICVQADALLICLADMPLVPLGHFASLVQAVCAEDRSGIVSSFDGQSRSPPAVFAKEHFTALAGLSGNNGARELIAGGAVIECSAEALLDIDTPQQCYRGGAFRENTPE